MPRRFRMELAGSRGRGHLGFACVRMSNRWWGLLILFGVVAFAAHASAATYYVDFVNGADSNTGTAKAAAWKLAPGMNGFAGTYAHSPGDVFIFKGGVTWPAAVLPLT